nr:leukocyte tyrosine kinase receptor isoform X2 [Manis javanica]
MGRSGRLLLWLGAAGAILCSSSGSQVLVPNPWYSNVTYPPSGLEPASPLIFPGTEGPWLFSTCGASGRRGPTQTQCDRAYAGSSVVVTVGTTGPLRGVQLWQAPRPGQYLISAYGAAGGKGAKNHLSRAHGVFVSTVFSLALGEPLYIIVGQQGEDACPGGSQESQLVCLGESRAAEEHATDGTEGTPGSRPWAGGGGGGGGATYVFRLSAGKLEPLLVAAGGGGRAYLRRQDRGGTQAAAEKLENRSAAPGSSGRGGAAGGGGGWTSRAPSPQAGRSLQEGAEGGQGCAEAWATLGWAAAGGFGGGGGACTAGGGGGGYQGGDASETDILWADGEDGVSFIHPSSELYLQPLTVMESHGEVEIRLHLNCSHCLLKDCQWQAKCMCPEGLELATDNITCVDLPTAPGPLFLLMAVVVASTLSLLMVCGVLILVNHKRWLGLWGTRLPGPELELSKLRTSTIKTAPNPYYCQVRSGPAQSWPLPPGLTEVSPANVTLLRALGHGAFGEVYEGLVIGLPGDPSPLQVAIKTLPGLCSRHDELDFLMEALIIRYACGQGQGWKLGERHPELLQEQPVFILELRGTKSRDIEILYSFREPRAWFLSLLVMGYIYHLLSKFSHQNIVRCVGLSLQAAPRLILLELMSGGDMKSFLRHSRLHLAQPSPLVMQDLLQLAKDIAQGCHYLEENHFIHRASYYCKGGQSLLPVKWMPPEAFLEGIFTSKTDSWSFGVLLWEIFSLGYMPYPGRTNQEVLNFVVGGGRMDSPRGCPGPVYHIMTRCWQHQPELRPGFDSILEHLQYCIQDPEVLNSPLLMELGPNLEEKGASELGSRSLESLSSPQAQELNLESLNSWRGSFHGSWLSSGLKPPKPRRLQPQNLWNPTYGSWAPRGPEGEDSGTEGSTGSSPHSSPGF